jgi:hypothetical protein
MALSESGLSAQGVTAGPTISGPVGSRKPVKGKKGAKGPALGRKGGKQNLYTRKGK